MLLYFFVTVILLGNPEILLSTGNEMNLNLCTNKETIAVQIATTTGTAGTTCQCQAGPPRNPEIREEYVHTPGIGSHKLHVVAKSWNDARMICLDEGGHLAIINSKAEEAVFKDMLSKAKKKISGVEHGAVDQGFVGVHDLYKEGVFVTIFDEPLEKVGFAEWTTKWGSKEPNNYKGNQNCVSLVAQGGLDDRNCEHRHAFFCELPLPC